MNKAEVIAYALVMIFSLNPQAICQVANEFPKPVFTNHQPLATNN